MKQTSSIFYNELYYTMDDYKPNRLTAMLYKIKKYT